MSLGMIVARARNNVIGKEGEIPWHYPEDLQHFKETTMDGTIIMGRKTFESPGVLPGREVIVITRTKDYEDRDVVVARSPEDAVEKASNEDIWICGGEGIYEAFMGDVDKIIVSEIPEKPNGDTYFPEIPDEYEKVSVESKNTFEVVEYQRESVER